MTETQKRIKAYRAALPELRERVVAVALLLVMSLSMMVSATFAWVTLSAAPEVSGVSTTVAANGNLEIALSNKEGTQPGESAVGDSSATTGQSVVNANMTWGNLVNLSDPSYGLSNIVLRPALLGNVTNLLEQPLKGVDYGQDGRAELYYNEDFAYTSWVPEADGVEAYFGYFATPQYGVRAISTTEVTYQNRDYERFTELLKQAKGTRDAVNGQYDAMIANDEYIDALADLIGVFMTDKLNDSDTNVSHDTIESIYELMVEMEGIVDDYLDALVALANVQVFNKYGREQYENYDYTRETFLEAYNAGTLDDNGVEMKYLSGKTTKDTIAEYLRIQTVIQEALYGTDSANGVKDFYDRITENASATVKMSELNSIINKLVDINTCEIVLLSTGTRYKVGSIGAGTALDILGKDIDAVITKGALKDFEQLTGFKLMKQNVTVRAKYIVSVSMTAKTITTSAAPEYYFDKNVADTEAVQSQNKGDATIIAQDTYGMALDFWVRTNAENSYLTLEGNVITETSNVQATGVDMDGNTVNLYTVTITIPATAEGEEDYVQELAAYYDSSNVLRNANSHSLIYNEDGSVPEGQTISTPIPRMEEVVNIVGYEGENRVWEENALLSADSTTQGSGSCYVFYSDDPAQQLSSLQLLSNLRVAFVDCNEDSMNYGKKVAVGYLDTENYYAADGKFIVPLKLVDDGSAYLTYNGEEMAILPLEQNVATRLMAIVYLDGQAISNAEVLAANEIQGRLNIQFGSSEPLTTMGDEALEMATRSVSAQAKKSTDSAYGDNSSAIQFSYDQASETNPMKVDVAVTVDGDAPSTVTAFFMRRVNETQGSREDSFELTLDPATGKYVGTHEFTSPGNYVLRTVQLDGVDYDLPATSYPKVEIAGFSIDSVTCDAAMSENAVTIMTGNRSVSTNLNLKFSSNQTKVPNSVRLQFVSDDGSLITANMNYNSSTATWSGTANFTSSGTYTLRYVVMNGEYEELAPKFQRELTIYLGMSVRVRDTGEFNDVTFEGEPFTIPVYVEIYDNTGEEIPYLQGVTLKYDRAGSILTGMDPSLKWNAAQDCYMGNMQMTEPGYYTFNRVEVDGSYLTVTTEAPPTYTCISPEPPEYVDITMPEQGDYILAKSGETYVVEVRLSNAQAAQVSLVVTDADTGNEMTLDYVNASGTDDYGVSTFELALPTSAETGYQTGDWTVTKVLAANVFDEDANRYTQEAPMEFDISASSEDRHVQIVSVKVATSGKAQDFTGLAFMESAVTTEQITVKITDHLGRKLNVAVSGVQIRYQHDNNSSQSYGGYTAAHLDGTDDGELDTYTLSGDGMTYTLNNVKLTYAGVYNPYEFVFKVDGEDYPAYNSSNGWGDVDLPKYTLTTTAPTMAITAASPTGTFEADTTGVGSGHQSVTTAAWNANYAQVCFRCNRSGEGTTCSPYRHNYTRPSVTITVTGMGNATQATLSFGSGVQIYNGSTQTDSYTWTADGACARNIGYYRSRTAANDDKTAAGDMTSGSLTLTYNGMTFTATAPVIRINNPY